MMNRRTAIKTLGVTSIAAVTLNGEALAQIDKPKWTMSRTMYLRDVHNPTVVIITADFFFKTCLPGFEIDGRTTGYQNRTTNQWLRHGYFGIQWDGWDGNSKEYKNCKKFFKVAWEKLIVTFKREPTTPYTGYGVPLIATTDFVSAQSSFKPEFEIPSPMGKPFETGHLSLRVQ